MVACCVRDRTPIRPVGFVGSALLIALLAPAPPTGAETYATTTMFLGSFYSEIQGEEHLYQDQIDLWREGSRVFGLTTSFTGIGPRLGRFEGTLDEKSGSLHLFGSIGRDFRGTLTDSGLSGAIWSDALVQYELALDPMGSHASEAPTTSYGDWRTWADSLIDDAEAKDPFIQQDIEKCTAGDAWACVNVGNGLSYRKPEEARRYWKIACGDGNWAGCKFLGDQDRYLAILHRLCSTSEKPSLARNMACEELGAIAEKASRIDEAVHWYEIGCNEYRLPTTCCTRLKALHRGKKESDPR
jgi:hypothetical protein